MTVTIYHNPRCSKSRRALELLRQHGIEPRIVAYLETPPDEAELRRILGLLGIRPRELLRAREAHEAGIDPSRLNDDELIRAMAAHPAVIERPVVVSGNKAAVGRPPEKVLDVL